MRSASGFSSPLSCSCACLSVSSASAPRSSCTPRPSYCSSEFITTNFSKDDSPLLAALTKRFAVRQFKFASNAERVANASALTFDGTSSRRVNVRSVDRHSQLRLKRSF